MLDAKAFLSTVPNKIGVYQMLDASGKIIYVGKAKDLKKRLQSYFRSNLSPKTHALMEQAVDIKILITQTETESLILESQLIKSEKPRYNILLRDDKSYPYIVITQHKFPRLDFYRGSCKEPGKYFGPYPSVTAVRSTIHLLQKTFLLRQCSDTYFQNRTRPCLQYQIQRCSAPCVGYIDQKSYDDDIHYAKSFLEGKSETIIQRLTARMQKASDEMVYEKAAKYRNQIASLRGIQEQQHVANMAEKNVDVMVMLQSEETVCLYLLVIRDGRVLGNKSFFPKVPADSDDQALFEAFVAQYYLVGVGNIPQAIVSNLKATLNEQLLEALRVKAGRKIKLYQRHSQEKAAWIEMALESARHVVSKHRLDKSSLAEKFVALQQELSLEKPPERLECFDISHHMGEATVASCVVMGMDGPIKNDYRRFNIKDVTAGDDFAAMRQALVRRYRDATENLPDILLIDGGKGQLSQAKSVMEELEVRGVLLIGIAKGKTRKPGFETLFFIDRSAPLLLSADSPALHLLQYIRDEAHRFAITHHRSKKQKRQTTSVLEQLPGIGAKRRRALLKHFGGLQGLQRTSAAEIAKVPGISKQLAELIYRSFHR